MVETMKRAGVRFGVACAVLLAATVAQAAGLRVERVDAGGTKESDRFIWPNLRGYVTVLGNNGAPITGLAKENFKVYENKTNEVSASKAQTLDASGYGVAIAIVIQSSGTMAPVMEDIKKAAAGFLGTLGEKDQAAIVVYSDKVEIASPMGDKGAAANAVNKMDNPGFQKLLWDGVAQALGQFSAPKLPAARAIIVIGDGGDAGSSAGPDSLVADAKKKRIPVFAIGHSETGDQDLEYLKNFAVSATGIEAAYVPAPQATDFPSAFSKIQTMIMKQWVVEWKADDIESDTKTYPVEIEMQLGDVKLRGSGEVTTPLVKDYTKLIVILVIVVLLLAAIGGVIWWKTRPPPPEAKIFCPVCKNEQMKDWDVCLFCLKNAKATLLATKGPSTGKRYPLVGKTVKVGKGPENAIKIFDASVSTNHCGIQVDGTKFEVVDLGSSNGTFVNGKRTQKRFLKNGDVLTLGNSELRFESTIKDTDTGDYSDEA